jgi:RNA polymerase sigma-70 factor (ECF subfamily)
MAQSEATWRAPGVLEGHSAALRAFFRRRVGHDAEVDDLVQETFTRALNRSRTDPIENISGYLFQIAANLLLERARRSIRHRSVGAGFLSAGLLEGGSDFSPERVHAARQACALVESALRELPARVRNVFVLNRFEELTGVEIARRLGVSLSTVEKDMARAILHLKERLK